MSRQSILEQFQDDPNATYLGLIPVSAVAKSEHETLIIGAVERYSDRAVLSVHLRLGPDHPEHEWRDRGRPGHPVLLMQCADDVGTEYAVMPQGGGGGHTMHRFELAIAPPIPDNATKLTLEFPDVAWDDRPRLPLEDDAGITWRWRVEVDLGTQIAPNQISESGNA